MEKKTVILVIAHEGYQQIEYGITRDVLMRKGIEVITASDLPGRATGKDSSSTDVDITIDDINPDNIDGLFLIGGPGALPHLDTDAVHTLLQQLMALKKPYGAICIASRILAQANVLGGKKATGWDGDDKLEEIFKNYAVTYVRRPVVTDGTIVTATGPDVAQEFGEAIARVLTSQIEETIANAA